MSQEANKENEIDENFEDLQKRVTQTIKLRTTLYSFEDVMKVLRHYEQALKKISELENATEMRSPLADIGVPDHLIKQGGWVPIDPRFKDGLCFAAKIAADALNIDPRFKNGLCFSANIAAKTLNVEKI